MMLLALSEMVKASGEFEWAASTLGPVAGGLAVLGINLVLQASVVLAVGLMAHRLLTPRWKDAAARATVVGLLAIPLAAMAIHLPRFGLFALPLPEPVTHAAGEPARWSVLGLAMLGLAGLWAIGAAWHLCGVGYGWARVAGIRRRSRPVDPDTAQPFRAMAERMGLVAIDLRQSSEIRQPCLVGIRRPTVLLPAGAMPASAVLAHEFTHARRRDPLRRLAFAILLALGWFHPLLRKLDRIRREQAEHACDAVAVRTHGDRHGYARLLLAYAARPATSAPASVSAPTLTAFADDTTDLRRRIAEVLDPPLPPGGSSRTRSGLASGAIWAAGAGLAAASATVGVLHTQAAAAAGLAWIWCAG